MLIQIAAIILLNQAPEFHFTPPTLKYKVLKRVAVTENAIYGEYGYAGEYHNFMRGIGTTELLGGLCAERFDAPENLEWHPADKIQEITDVWVDEQLVINWLLFGCR